MILNVLSKLHAKMLPKLGVIKTFPILMRIVPAFLGGMNMHLLEVEAIAQAIHHLVSLCSADTATKFLLKMIIECHQMELGTDKQTFKLDYDSCGVLTIPAWITSLWQNTSFFNISIELPALNLGIVQQERDEFTSDSVLRLNFATEQQQSINRVRLSLQLLLISDLLIHNRTTIKHATRHGLIDESYISTLC